MTYSCNFCCKHDVEPHPEYMKIGGGHICGSCCIGDLQEGRINVAQLMVEHDMDYNHGSVIERIYPGLISGPLHRLRSMKPELMQLLGAM